jgi:uncharacterized membrane protein YqaE (UPF0057 family)
VSEAFFEGYRWRARNFYADDMIVVITLFLLGYMRGIC